MFDGDLWIEPVLRGLVLSVAAMAWIIALTRVVGLRSFSKMTNFDFVMTVAMGSLLAGASQSTGWPGRWQSLAAMAGLFLAQRALARARRASARVEDAVQNEPVILMRDGTFCEAALAATRVARSDLYAKLRSANVRDLSRVRAVVLETTGDISVLHGDRLDEVLLTGTRSGPVEARGDGAGSGCA